MNEITPDLIASIATRLFNEIPGAGSVPRTEIDAQQMPTSEMQMPVDTTIMPARSLPEVTSVPVNPPTQAFSGFSHIPADLPRSADSPTQAFNGFSHVPTGSPRAAESPTSRTSEAPPAPEGLRAFVQRVQNTGLRSDSGRCTDPGQDAISRLFKGKTLPSESSRPFDVQAIRKDFPILHQRIHGKPLAWLDNAATTQKPQSVIDVISRFYATDNSNIHRGAHTLAARATDAYEQARQKIQAFIGASSVKEIVLVRGTTEGINLIAATFGRKFLQPGDEIILSTLEHHANIVPWQMVAKEKGAILRVIPVNDRGEIMLQEYQAMLGPRTKVVSITQASNGLGTILPVAEMTQMAKRYNARVLIDGAQSVAHMPVNVQQLGADFFVFSGHKIFGPTGIGVVWGKEELLHLMPPYQGGGNMIRDVTFEETTYNDPPMKFEAGTPNIADTVALGAALDYVNRLGLPNIEKYEHELLQYGTEQLSRINGLRLIGTAREKVGVLSFVLKDRRTEEIGKLLDLEGIAVRAGHHCAQPSLRRFGVETTVRPSLSIYNTPEEIDRLAEAIKRILRM
ncbi:MAG: SufS family cysteine desulfurase [Planctomycetes bacterium]|nr:SufS family cysteine desulfurase [Planctomycetota bacterium]